MDPVILIFAGVAAFVIFRLISVLGERTGHEQGSEIDAFRRAAKAHDQERSADSDDIGDADSEADGAQLAPVSAAARPLRDADPIFNEREYLDGAKAAYEMIIEAFTAGDLKSIRRFLGEPVYNAFKSALGAREAAGHSADIKFVGVESAAITKAEIVGDEMHAITDFASNQVRVTVDKEGNVVDGDANRIDLVKDRWTFSRKLKNKDPNWILVATDTVA